MSPSRCPTRAAGQLDDETVNAAEWQVDSWLARVRWRGPDSVHADVSLWNTVDLPPRFGLAKEILLAHREEALAKLPTLIEQGEITRSNLKTWPLFDSIRDEPAVQLLLENSSLAGE